MKTQALAHILYIVSFTFFMAPSLYAAEGSEVSESTYSRLKSNFDLTYSFLLSGPSIQHLDANPSGRGTSITMRNYLVGDWNLSRNHQIEIGWEARRYWRPEDPRRGPQPTWEPRDPYIGFVKKRVIDTETFSLKVQANYFFPVSEATKKNIGKVDDEGNGEINLTLSPKWSLWGDNLSLGIPTDFYFGLAKNPKQPRENAVVRAKPEAIFMFSRHWAGRVAYSTGYLRHRKDGRWSKFNDPYTGQKIYLGPIWVPTGKLMIHPELAWGEGSLQLRKTGINLFVSYFVL